MYLEKLLDLGNSGGSSDEDDVVNVGLVHFGIAERFLDGLQSATEKIGAKIFETRACDGSVEVDALEKRVDLDPAEKKREKRINKVLIVDSWLQVSQFMSEIFKSVLRN